MTLQDAEALLDLPPAASERALKAVGTRAFREAVIREKGVTDEDEIVAELHREFIAPFLHGSQKPAKSMHVEVRREIVHALQEGLPKRTLRLLRDALARHDVSTVYPDRALLALAVVMEAPKERLLSALGYEFSELEEGA